MPATDRSTGSRPQAVLTSLQVPLTLPSLVSLLMGQCLEIPFSHMARLLEFIL